MGRDGEGPLEPLQSRQQQQRLAAARLAGSVDDGLVVVLVGAVEARRSVVGGLLHLHHQGLVLAIEGDNPEKKKWRG